MIEGRREGGRERGGRALDNGDTYLEKEAEADPLIVLDVLLVGLVLRRPVNTWMRYLDADFLEVGAVDGVRRVDPAVGVEHVFRNILGVDAVDRVAHILSRRHNQAERQQYHHRDAVVQPEHGRVDVDVADFDQVLQAAKYVEHVGGNGAGFAGRRTNKIFTTTTTTTTTTTATKTTRTITTNFDEPVRTIKLFCEA